MAQTLIEKQIILRRFLDALPHAFDLQSVRFAESIDDPQGLHSGDIAVLIIFAQRAIETVRVDNPGNLGPGKALVRLIREGFIDECGASLALSRKGCALLRIDYQQPIGHKPGIFETEGLIVGDLDWS